MGQGSKWTPAQREARLGKLVERNRAKHSGPRLYEDAAWMRNAYVERGLSLREMAAEAECGLRTVARWMEHHNIPTDPNRGREKPTGPASPSWRGGPERCPTCDGPKAYYSRACAKCRDKTGSQNPKWRHDPTEVSYEIMHGRVRAARGDASNHPCAHCGGVAAQWAYDHSDPDERRLSRREEGPFSLDVDRYMPMCHRCHKRFDMAWIKTNRKSAISRAPS